MRSLPPLAVACLLLAAGCADRSRPASPRDGAPQPVTPVIGATPVGTVYGRGVTLAESVPISAIHDDIERYLGQHVRVEGLVTDVCPTRGCWIDIASDREFETLRLKVEDGAIVFPPDVQGRYAVAEGVVTRIEHGPEQAGEHGQGGCAEPGTIVRLDGTGAVVRAAR